MSRRLPQHPDQRGDSGRGGPPPLAPDGRAGDAATLSGSVRAVLTLVPRRRLLAALAAGAALIALTVVSALLWPVAVAYHAVLGWLVVRDARRLPAPDRFLASR